MSLSVVQADEFYIQLDLTSVTSCAQEAVLEDDDDDH